MYSCLYYVFRSRFGSSAPSYFVRHGGVGPGAGAGAGAALAAGGAAGAAAGAAGCAGGADRGADGSDLGAGGSDRGAGGAYRGGGGGAGSSAHSRCGRAMVADPALELRHGLFINKLKVKSIKHIINNSFLSNTKFEIKYTSNNKHINIK